MQNADLSAETGPLEASVRHCSFKQFALIFAWCRWHYGAWACREERRRSMLSNRSLVLLRDNDAWMGTFISRLMVLQHQRTVTFVRAGLPWWWRHLLLARCPNYISARELTSSPARIDQDPCALLKNAGRRSASSDVCSGYNPKVSTHWTLDVGHNPDPPCATATPAADQLLFKHWRFNCRMTNYELLRWSGETPSRDLEHYRMFTASRSPGVTLWCHPGWRHVTFTKCKVTYVRYILRCFCSRLVCFSCFFGVLL